MSRKDGLWLLLNGMTLGACTAASFLGAPIPWWLWCVVGATVVSTVLILQGEKTLPPGPR